MGLEGLKKIKKGLPLFIEGLIEDSEDTIEEGGEHSAIREILEFRIKRIDEYLSTAEMYAIPKEKIRKLRLKYNSLKARIENTR